MSLPPLKEPAQQQDESAQSNNTQAKPTSPITSNDGPKDIHVNELLCFLQNKLETLPKDIVTKYCVDFFKPEEISAAKDLLFHTVRTSRRNRNYIGSDKSQKDISDMRTVMLEMKVPHEIQFAALDLGNLPAISFDNMDLVKLCRDIESVRTSIGLLQSNQKVFTNFMSETLNARAGTMEKQSTLDPPSLEELPAGTEVQDEVNDTNDGSSSDHSIESDNTYELDHSEWPTIEIHVHRGHFVVLSNQLLVYINVSM